MASHLSNDLSFQFNDTNNDPLEALLMSSTSFFLTNDVTINSVDCQYILDNENANANDNNDDEDGNGGNEVSDGIDLAYSRDSPLNNSPTYNPENSSIFSDINSIYQINDANSLSDCNSFDDFSTISNIIYTNKMKEKLRKMRSSSSDLSLFSNSKISKTSNANNTIAQSSSLLNKRQQSRSNSVDSLIIQSNHLASFSKASHPTKRKNLPNITIERATNPFYRPPDLLKRLSNDV